MKKDRVQIGEKYGKLTVVEKGHYKNQRQYYICKCECGNLTGEIRDWDLILGNTKSCGCLRKAWQHEIGKHNKKYSGCLLCNSTKHYAHGLCNKHYIRWWRGALTPDQFAIVNGQQK